ncbi:MAG TPA: DRTGG domain-containing protein [Selenomonadales bacterium]|nr:DRTGG domain-containing protein [Selenomonadales bacterium]
MKLSDVKAILQAEVICGAEHLDQEAITVCGADLMSDVLAFSKEKTLLLTGLTNVQVIRTAEMGDLVGIVFVRGKRPGPEVIDMARDNGIPLMVTEYPLFESCGLLYSQGSFKGPRLAMTSDV